MCNVFDLKEGANFKLKIRKVDGNANYDKSEFSEPSSIDDVSDQYTVENDINQFIDPKRFKTAEKLQERLDFVRGAKGTTKSPAKAVESEYEQEDVPDHTQSKPKAESKRAPVVSNEEDDDDIMKLVNSLANDD